MDNFVLTSNSEYKLLDDTNAKSHGHRIEITSIGCGHCQYQKYVDVDEAIDVINAELKKLLDFKDTLRGFKDGALDVCEMCEKVSTNLVSVRVENDTYSFMCKKCRDELEAMKEEAL
jgi:hypothetical protein